MNLYIPKGFYEKDKHQHFFVSAAIFAFLASLTDQLAFAFIATLYIGLLKEIWDHYAGSGFCWKDIIANLFGAATTLLVWIALESAV